jgi:hypothetical protein
MISKLRQLEERLSLTAGKQLLFVLGVLVLTTLSCVVDEFADEPTITPAPQQASDYLTYTSPTYNISLSAGEIVPGTRLQYVGRAGEVYNVSIDGQPLTRQGGDSLPWQGVVAPGVFGKYNLRITPSFGIESLIAAGPVELIILNPVPTEVANLPLSIDSAYHYTGVLVGEAVPVGQVIPGTTLIYAGETAQGASFSGTTQYPFRALGDSLVWLGQLRDNVYIRHNLRVITFDADRLRLGGTAEIWVIPGR